jgi:hypothetical protein
VKIRLRSTDRLDHGSPPSRVWKGRTEDGVPVVALVLLLASPRDDEEPEVLERTRAALQTRIESSAVITIPIAQAAAAAPGPDGPIAGEWRSYREGVLPAEAPDVQVLETKRAFYAGAWALLQLMLNLDEGTLDATDQDLRVMDVIHQELQSFGAGGGLDLDVTGGGPGQ